MTWSTPQLRSGFQSHLPNPPRHLRANATGLSRRLQKEFLQKVQEELVNAVTSGYDDLLPSTEQEAQGRGNVDGRSNMDAPLGEEVALPDPDIDVIVTICCEEGRHRSVAFVEELA